MKTHGFGRHWAYQSWHAMMSRCYDPMHASFSRYGGRGISVFLPWHDPAVYCAFAEMLSGRQPGMTLDRIDNDGDYVPGNVRWASHETQSYNRRGAQTRNGKPVTSKYKGVCRCSRSGRWIVQITHRGVNRYVGRFVDETEAALAYDKAASEVFGADAYLNFPKG